MISKYIINNDPKHYVLFTLDAVNKKAAVSYVRSDVEKFKNEIDVSSILDLSPTLNPRVQVAKMGRVWDFLLSKPDSAGKIQSKKFGIVTDVDVTPSNVSMSNDTDDTIALKNFVVHPLTTYSSPRLIADYQFASATGVTGKSSANDNVPLLSVGQELKVGYQADLTLALTNEMSMVEPYVMTLQIPYFGSNTISSSDQLEVSFGENKLIIGTVSGVKLISTLTAGTTIFQPTDVVPSSTLQLIVDTDSVYLALNDVKVLVINSLSKNGLADSVTIKGFCNSSDYTLIKSLTLYQLEE